MKKANVALIDDEKHIADFYSKIIRDTFLRKLRSLLSIIQRIFLRVRFLLI